MKRIALLFFVAIAIAAVAQVNISKTEKASPSDELFMDMAVTAAKQSVASGGKPSGTVIILNGAWKATGTPTKDATAEENAITRSNRTTLPGAIVYTVNEPTVQALNALMEAEVDEVYYVNSSADAVAAGIYTAADYDAAGLDSTLTPVSLYRIAYSPASNLLKKQ